MVNFSMPNYKRTIVRKSIRSSFLQEDRELSIYLPPGYQELLTYPVIYCQDGEQFFNFGRIATQATRLILEEDMQPVIIVGVHVNPAQRNADYHPLGERHEAYCRFFTDEMLPFIENEYPVRSDARERILAGDSLGGAVSLHLALNQAKLFQRVLSLSGAFYEPSLQAVSSQKDCSWLDLWMVVGLQETEVKTDHGIYHFLQQNRDMKQLLEQKNAILHYSEQDGQHIWGFWQQQLPAALQYFLNR